MRIVRGLGRLADVPRRARLGYRADHPGPDDRDRRSGRLLPDEGHAPQGRRGLEQQNTRRHGASTIGGSTQSMR